MIIIRQAIAEDAVHIAKLSAQLGYQNSVDKTTSLIEAIYQSINDMAYVAMDNEEAVGWVHAFYTLRLESGPFCEIGGLVVNESHRNKGIGKLLILKVVEWCNSKNSKVLRLRTNVNRTETHKFYRHLNFKETKEQKVFELHIAETY